MFGFQLLIMYIISMHKFINKLDLTNCMSHQIGQNKCDHICNSKFVLQISVVQRHKTVWGVHVFGPDHMLQGTKWRKSNVHCEHSSCLNGYSVCVSSVYMNCGVPVTTAERTELLSSNQPATYRELILTSTYSTCFNILQTLHMQRREFFDISMFREKGSALYILVCDSELKLSWEWSFI